MLQDYGEVLVQASSLSTLEELDRCLDFGIADLSDIDKKKIHGGCKFFGLKQVEWLGLV